MNFSYLPCTKCKFLPEVAKKAMACYTYSVRATIPESENRNEKNSWKRKWRLLRRRVFQLSFGKEKEFGKIFVVVAADCNLNFLNWLFLYIKLGWKIGQKPLFSRFWDKEAFTKNFQKSISSLAKDTQSCAKIFQKLFKVEIVFFAKVFIFFFINFFHRDCYIFKFRYSWPTENVPITCHGFVA